jgi:hypothetical protein
MCYLLKVRLSIWKAADGADPAKDYAGYRELMTHRSHLVDMPTHLGLAYVPLDGIGCTFTLIKAHVHREGVTFPTYTFENQVRRCLPAC